MKIYALITELQTWCSFTSEELAKAKASTKTVPAYLLDGYMEGAYDEDIDQLGRELIYCL